MTIPGSLPAKLIAWLLSGSVLGSLWLPVWAAWEAPPVTAQDFWIEAFRAFVVIMVSLMAVLMGLLYRVWRERIVKLEDFATETSAWTKKTERATQELGYKIEKRQRLMVELLGVVAYGIKMDTKLEQQATQLLYELRREDS